MESVQRQQQHRRRDGKKEERAGGPFVTLGDETAATEQRQQQPQQSSLLVGVAGPLPDYPHLHPHLVREMANTDTHLTINNRSAYPCIYVSYNLCLKEGHVWKFRE